MLRFLWDRSLSAPISARLIVNSNGTGTLIVRTFANGTLINLDYLYEERFQNLVAARFSPLQAAVMGDVATESFSRSRSFFVYKNYRSEMDMESFWAVSSAGTIGFVSSIGIQIGQVHWSLPDVAANIIQTLSLANDVLTAQGYYGEIDISIEVAPGGARLSKEGDAFAVIQRKDCFQFPAIANASQPLCGEPCVRLHSYWSAKKGAIERGAPIPAPQVMNNLHSVDKQQARKELL